MNQSKRMKCLLLLFATILPLVAPGLAATPAQALEQVPRAAGNSNLASGRPTKASSKISNVFQALLAVDGKGDTRWSSEVLDDQWLAVDLGEDKTVSGVELAWETAFAAEYVIEISADGEQWREVARNSNGQGGTESLRFEPVTTRWIRMRALKRATVFGVSLWEFRVTADTVAATPSQALEEVPRTARWVVWAERPARSWEDSFVTGNGRHGTMVEGRPGDERIVCVHEELFFRLWDREKVAVADIAKLLPEVRRLTDAGQTGAAATLADSEARRQLTEMGAPQIWPLSPHPAFDLRITTGNATNSTDYRRQLNMETGEALTRWDGVEMRVFSSRTHNANIVQIRATNGQKLDAGIGLEETPGRRANVFRSVCADATPGWLTYHAEYAADRGGYEGLARVTIKGGQMETEGNRLHVRGAEEILAVVRITPVANGTSYRQDALRKELARWPENYQSLLAPHAREHGAMFRRVTLDLGCAAQWAETPTEKMLATAHEQGVTPLFLEQMHAMGRYLLISSCGRYPPPLQGIWGGSWEPNWCGGFVVDANLNLAISAASMGDLPECAESYFGYVERVLPGWRLNAKRYLGCRGFIVPHYSDPEKGYLNHFNLTCPWMYWPASGGWCILPFFEHAQLTGDRDFLKKRVLPLYREMADFYEDYLTLGADGRYHLSPGISPENVPTGTPTLLCRDATMDVAVARQVFDVLLQAGQQLKLDRADIAKWQAYRDRLPAYRVNEDGALAEWVDPRYRDIYEHRHNSHLYPVFPGTELLRPDADPALLKAAQVALDKRFAHDTDSAFGLMQVALTAARLHDVDKVRTNLDRFSRRNYVFAGLATAHYPNFFVYNLDSVLSLPRLLMEMLVFSQPGRIELLPAWPKGFPDGHINGVRISGGHKIDLSWAGGKLLSATVHPGKNDKCELICAGVTKSVTLKAGRDYHYQP